MKSSSLRGFNACPCWTDDGDDPLLIVITAERQVALALHGRQQPAPIADAIRPRNPG